MNEMIPYVMGGKQYFFSAQPYNAVKIAGPGRHAKDTTPRGGDFVVMIDDESLDWVSHKFTHQEIFSDIERKYSECGEVLGSLMDGYLEVVLGADPEKFLVSSPELYTGLHPHTFLRGVQLLAVAEHRRYHQYESKLGGRFLPLRAAAGIAEGLWTAAEASDRTRTRGRIGVEWLEKERGVPMLTESLKTMRKNNG